LFVGERINQNEVGRVFIQDSRDPETTITFTSERGQFSSINGQPVFLLLNGQRTELTKDGVSNAQLTFKTHTLDISRQSAAATQRVVLDMNEDSIRNLLNPETAKAEQYARERMAMGHYRLTSPFMALALTLMAAAIMLQGHISREKMGRRVLIAALVGIAIPKRDCCHPGLMACYVSCGIDADWLWDFSSLAAILVANIVSKRDRAAGKQAQASGARLICHLCYP
jgi:lipopolysaccharide export LptBFGC system permease protein LptF